MNVIKGFRYGWIQGFRSFFYYLFSLVFIFFGLVLFLVKFFLSGDKVGCQLFFLSNFSGKIGSFFSKSFRVEFYWLIYRKTGSVNFIYFYRLRVVKSNFQEEGWELGQWQQRIEEWIGVRIKVICLWVGGGRCRVGEGLEGEGFWSGNSVVKDLVCRGQSICRIVNSLV